MPAGCNPHGLALGPKHQLCVGCSNSTAPTIPLTVIIDDTNGSVVASTNKLGGSDEVWFNEGDYRYYLAASNNAATTGGPVLGVIDAKTNQWVENIPGGPGAHSVAANSTNNHIFFPLTIPNAGGSPTVPALLQKQGLGLGIAVFEHEGEHGFEHER